MKNINKIQILSFALSLIAHLLFLNIGISFGMGNIEEQIIEANLINLDTLNISDGSSVQGSAGAVGVPAGKGLKGDKIVSGSQLNKANSIVTASVVKQQQSKINTNAQKNKPHSIINSQKIIEDLDDSSISESDSGDLVPPSMGSVADGTIEMLEKSILKSKNKGKLGNGKSADVDVINPGTTQVSSKAVIDKEILQSDDKAVLNGHSGQSGRHDAGNGVISGNGGYGDSIIPFFMGSFTPGAKATWYKKPELKYPAQAEKELLEGDVKLILDVSKDFSVKQVILDEKSGYAVLDNAAVRWAYSCRIKVVNKSGIVTGGKVKLVVPFRIVKR